MLKIFVKVYVCVCVYLCVFSHSLPQLHNLVENGSGDVKRAINVNGTAIKMISMLLMGRKVRVRKRELLRLTRIQVSS